MQPVEESGIFGDSWRSNFEERVQVRSDGTVKYWKGDGSSLFYAYSYAYYMTAPLDDQTTLNVDNNTSQWIIGQKDGTTKYFNFNGYLTSIVDRNGNTTTISVDASHQNRIASVTDAAGRTLNFTYGNTNFPRLCTAISDASGPVAYYFYDSSGRLMQVAYTDGSQYNFSYDSNNMILSVTDAQAAVLEQHTYDSQQRGLSSSRANGADAVTIYYSTSSPQTSVVNSLGQWNTLTFNTTGQRQYVSLTGPGGGCDSCGFLGLSSVTKIFSSTGQPVVYTDPSGKQSFYTYDAQGNLTSKIVPEGSPFTNVTGYDTWSYTYNSFGEVLTSTDPLGATTTNTYDSKGNLLSTTTPAPSGSQAGSTTTFSYDNQGDLLTITDPLNHATTLTYYTTGLIHTISDAQSNVTTYAYDARGNRTSVTDAASHQTQFQYDSMNRLTQITYPDSSTVQFAYDYRGRRTSATDQNGKVTQ